MNELLPCPFCGGPVDVEKTHIGPMGMQFWGVKCRNTLNVGGTCAIEQIPSGSRDTAIARWNSRATTVATVPVELVGAGPTPDYTGEGSAWVPPVEARAVVVPELTEEALVRAGGPYCINDREPFQRGARWAVEFVREHSRAIPAGRVPGDGMVAVTPEYLDAAWGLDDMSDLEMFMWFRDNQEESGSDAQRVAKIFWREAQEWKKHQRKKFDALRANKGGADHGNV